MGAGRVPLGILLFTLVVALYGKVIQEGSAINVTKYNCSNVGNCNCRVAEVTASGLCDAFPEQGISYNVSCDPVQLTRTCVSYSLYSTPSCEPNSSLISSSTTELASQCKILNGLVAFGSGEMMVLNSSSVQLELGCFSSSNASENTCDGCSMSVGPVQLGKCTLVGLYTSTSYYILVKEIASCTAFTTSIYFGTTCTAPALVNNVRVANFCVNNTLVGCEYAATVAPSTAQVPSSLQPTTALIVPNTTSLTTTASPSTWIPTTKAPEHTTGNHTDDGNDHGMLSGEKYSIGGAAVVAVLAGLVLGVHFYRKRLEQSVPAVELSNDRAAGSGEHASLIQNSK